MKEFWEKHKANIGLAVLVVYTVGLGVATADQVFDLGLFPAKLDRMIAESINKFDSAEKTDREAGLHEILQYGDFSVPQLIDALDRSQQTRNLAIQSLKAITGQELEDPKKWKQWYEQHKQDY